MLIWLIQFILPILAEYADAGYRDPKGRLLFSLRANAQYQALILGAGLLGMIYVFISYQASLNSLKGTVMALAYCWGLMLAIYLMGHGLVALPRRLFRNASISGKLKRIQGNSAKVHEKMEDAIQNLEDFEGWCIPTIPLSRRLLYTALEGTPLQCKPVLARVTENYKFSTLEKSIGGMSSKLRGALEMNNPLEQC